MKKSKIEFFFEIAKEANMAFDEDGNPSACFLKITFNLQKAVDTAEIDAEREKNKDNAIKAAAEMTHIDKSFLTIISEETYTKSVDD